jgi:hypothetical protein
MLWNFSYVFRQRQQFDRVRKPNMFDTKRETSVLILSVKQSDHFFHNRETKTRLQKMWRGKTEVFMADIDD